MTEMMSQHDECCSKPFQRASLAGKLENTNTWNCPKCGCEWRGVASPNGVRVWSPFETLEVFTI